MLGWCSLLLRAPLAVKLAGANALIVVAALAIAAARGGASFDRPSVLAIAAVALVLSVVANVALVSLALRPLRALEAVAERVCGGELGARVVPSPLADRDIARVGEALNLALDGLAGDRGRARALAAATVRTAEAERSRIARELHDSLAQSLAALTYQLSAVTRDAPDPVTRAQIEGATAMARGILDDVRALAETVHPRVLEDLGLAAALRHLARVAGERSAATIVVSGDGVPAGLPRPVELVLYRVAHEAVTNALRHATAQQVHVQLGMDPVANHVTLDVTDDGGGFDLPEAERRRPGMGLFIMRERVALVDGQLEIRTRSGEGTRVRAIIPLLQHDEMGSTTRSAPLSSP